MQPIIWKNEKRKISELIHFEQNPRQLSEKDYKDLRKSLEKFNLAEIPAINTDNTIIAGHQRLKILAELKGPDCEIDVRVPNKKLTEKDFKEYLIRSNKNTGSWDWDGLANNFEMSDLLDWGFEEKEFAIFEAEEEMLPDLKDIEKDFQQISFIVHVEQAEKVQTALTKAVKNGLGESSVNENKNGNALFFICQKYLDAES